MEDLNKRVINIEIKNKKIEIDNAWRNSWTRNVLLLILIYLIALFCLKFKNSLNLYLWALLPCFGFLLSTLILKLVKKIWIKKYISGGSKWKKVQ